jgi:hypothetical protein
MKTVALALAAALAGSALAADREVVKIKPENVYIDLSDVNKFPRYQRPAVEKQIYTNYEKSWKKKFDGKLCEASGKLRPSTGAGHHKEMTMSLAVGQGKVGHLHVSFKEPQKQVNTSTVYVVQGTAEVQKDGNVPRLVLKDAEIVEK